MRIREYFINHELGHATYLGIVAEAIVVGAKHVYTGVEHTGEVREHKLPRRIVSHRAATLEKQRDNLATNLWNGWGKETLDHYVTVKKRNGMQIDGARHGDPVATSRRW